MTDEARKSRPAASRSRIARRPLPVIAVVVLMMILIVGGMIPVSGAAQVLPVQQTAAAQASAAVATANAIATIASGALQTAVTTLTPQQPATATQPPPTATNTATSTNTPSRTPSPTNTARATNTTQPTATNTSRPTNTTAPTETNTPRPTNTVRPTNTTEPTETNTPRATSTPRVTNTTEPTATNTPRATNTARPTNTTEPTETNTPRPTSTALPTNTPTETNSPTPTLFPTNTAAFTATPDATATPAATATAVLPESGGSVSETDFAEDNFGGWTYDPANVFIDEIDGVVLIRLGGDSTTMEYIDASRLALPYIVEVDFRIVSPAAPDSGADLSVSVEGETGYSLAAVSVAQESLALISGSDAGVESVSSRLQPNVGVGSHTLQFEVTANRITSLLDGQFVDTMFAQPAAGRTIILTANAGAEVYIGGMRVVTAYSTTFADASDLDPFEFPEGAITLEQTKDGLDVARVDAPEGFVVFSLEDSEKWQNYIVNARVQIEQTAADAAAQEISLLTRINADGAYNAFLHIQGGAAGLLYQSARTGEVTLQAPVQFDSTLTVGQWYDLQVQVAKTVISFYLDGKLIGETHDVNPAFGRIGFVVAPGAVVLLDEVQVTPITTLVVEDSFDAAALEGWNYTPNGAVIETQADDRTVLRLGSTELVGFGSEENPVISSLDAFSLSFDLQFDAQATGTGELFVTLQRPDGALYSIVLTLPSQSIGLGDETGQLLASSVVAIARGEWHDVHIDVLPDRIDAYWDGILAFSSTGLTTGDSNLTFSVLADEIVYLDNIVVAEIAP